MGKRFVPHLQVYVVDTKTGVSLTKTPLIMNYRQSTPFHCAKREFL
jgi:hypothetical protein